MRLDLFLKTARLVKRRAIARELCDAGRVLVNGQAAKPAKEIRQGDRVILRLRHRIVEVEAAALPADGKHRLPERPFRLISETRLPPQDDER